MPHPRVGAARHLLARALPWAGVKALSMTLAGAMNVGLTGGAHDPGGLSSPQSLPLVGDAPPAVVVGILVGDEAL